MNWQFRNIYTLSKAAGSQGKFSTLTTTIMLCNPKFVWKNNWYFDLKLYIFPLPTHIFTKNGKTGSACFCQAEQTLCFSDQVLVLLCLLRSIKGKCLLSYAWRWWCWFWYRERETSGAVHSKASLTLEIFGDTRTTNTSTDK